MTVRFKEGPGLSMVPDPDYLTPREWLWWRLHLIINHFAHRYAPLSWARPAHESRWWRLNNWAADHWIPTWSERNPW